MKKDKFYKLINKKEYGKQTRYSALESYGYIDEDLKVAFSWEEKQFVATDILTGLSVCSGYGETLEYHIKKFNENMVESLNNTRKKYYYDNLKRAFEIVLNSCEPMTERKLNNLLNK